MNKRILSIWPVLLFFMVLSFFSQAAANDITPPSERVKNIAMSDNPNSPENIGRIIASDEQVRIIVQFADPAVADYKGGIEDFRAGEVNASGKLDLQSSAALNYTSRLAGIQDSFVTTLNAQAPSIRVDHKYQIAFNGISLKAPGSLIPQIRNTRGVKAVTVAVRHYPQMDASLQLIGLYSGLQTGGLAKGIWKRLGGPQSAGQGVKIADIDTGLDQTHPFFNPAGFTYPSGFPKGEAAYTTPKVIAARAYFRPDEPPDTSADCACPFDYSGHGSHTAGTMAGKFGTATPYGVKISGVAPAAQLMNYKIFYKNAVNGGEYSETPEELAALEDVIKDGADVVNNSWGGTALAYDSDPAVAAFNAAVNAGLIVVFSAGNDGPSANSIVSPGTGQNFITVGASTTNRIFALKLKVTAPEPVEPALTDITAAISSGPPVPSAFGPYPFIAAGHFDNETGCTPFPSGAFNGALALIGRGTCNFSVKVSNAANAGAVGVVIWNNVDGPPISMGSLESATIPAVMVDREDGLALKGWYDANPTAAELTIDASVKRMTKNSWQDAVASFSSRGPNPKLGIKPDLVAPGVNILSSVSGGQYDLYQGTSMAAPHVTGVAALVHQIHPSWAPWQVKSAIVNTTQLPESLDASCTDILGAPYPGPQCRGAGRLSTKNPGGPADPGLVLLQPSLSLGAQFQGGSFPVTLSAVNMASNGTYKIVIEQSVTDPGVSIVSSLPKLYFTSGQQKSFKITFTFSADARAGDYYGMINLNNTDGVHKLHMPYWFRILPSPDPGPADVLLIDDDGSNMTGLTDYRPYYTETLNTLGLSYAVLETDWNNCASPWDIARKYSKAILFTGDGLGFLYHCDFGIGSPNLNGMNNYFAGGGRLLMTGQDAAFGLSSEDNRDDDLKLYFGATLVQNNVFGAGLPPRPSAQAQPGNAFLTGVKLDFSSGADGAGNQSKPDEVDAMSYSDMDPVPLFKAITPANSGSGAVGVRLSFEPTIERVDENPGTLSTPLGYRTILLSFGLEAVNNTTGYTPRGTLLRKLLNWLDDDVSITPSPQTQTVEVNALAKLSAVAKSSASGKIVRYRWEWGDGKITSSGSSSFANHRYIKAGTYDARVEATDVYGHKVVSAKVQIVVIE